MIRITKFDGTSILLNPELIQTIEATPDTVITLTSGHQLVVKNSVEELFGSLHGLQAEYFIFKLGGAESIMIVSLVGLFLGMFAVIGGAVIEGLHLSALTQPTAALIVFGGTLGATMLACTGEEFSGAIKLTPKIFLGNAPDFSGLIKEIVDLANLARKEGLLALEKSVGGIKNPFFAQNLRKIVDGYDPVVLREMMEEKIFKTEEHANAIGKVFETGGGFSPTIGIIGAVLGLIHVMGNLSDSSKLGSGIAVAFVATVYGVGLANLILIPMGNKAKKIGKYSVEEMEIISTGLLAIQAGLNPRLIEDRLNNLHGEHGSHGKEGGSAAPASKAA